MKIVHLAPNAVYNDGWSYQENLLPKYHCRLGHEVLLITTTLRHEGNKIVHSEPIEFFAQDGFKVIRLEYERCLLGKRIQGVFCKLNVYKRLCEISPDIVFYHGLQSITILDVIRYKKKCEIEGRKVFIIQDNHADYNNSVIRNKITGKVLKKYYVLLNRYSQKYVERVYGVTPWRVQYAKEYYCIDSRRTDLLIMGADDEKINFHHRMKIREDIRKRLGTDSETFLVVTGGKIDCKKNIHLLMKACGELYDTKLIVFGSVIPELQDEFNTLLNTYKNIIYVGWLSAEHVPDYFFAGDLAVFPGGHSVLWEQACACKIPCLFKKWEGMEHVNNGGNSKFISNVTVEDLKEEILKLKYTDEYKKMKSIAESDATEIYLYSNIARKSLESIKKYEDDKNI